MNNDTLVKRLNIEYDINTINKELERIYPLFKEHNVNQLSVTNNGSDDLLGANGRNEKGESLEKTFKFVNGFFKNSFTEQVLNDLDWNCGRVRYMLLGPKQLLSIHSDEDDYRYHLAFKTTPWCFIMYPFFEKIFRIPKNGYVYKVNTKEFHTAINGTLDNDRIHLVINSF